MTSKNATKNNSGWLSPFNFKSQTGDPLGLDGVDHVEFYCGNARQAANYYASAFGFTPIAYRGPETGSREVASYVLKQHKLIFVLNSPLRATHPINHYISIHGDGVKSIALKVDDCEAFYYETLRRGAQSVEIPRKFEDQDGELKCASIKIYGDVTLKIIERKNYKGFFAPGFVSYNQIFPNYKPVADVGLVACDHIVGNVELGGMDIWVKFFEDVLGFKQMLHFTDDQISTEYSALMSKVVRDGTGKVKFPINEPAKGRRKSQIEEYLDFNYGPGVQHIAMLTGDIISTVSKMRERGVEFLSVPKTYYDDLVARIGSIKEDLQKIAELGILVDRDDDGYLLQLFTKPVQDRPTLFFEVIQRCGSQGFGVGNFKALFEAIERDQALRGNL